MADRSPWNSKYPDLDYECLIRIVERTPDKVVIAWCDDPDIEEVITNKKLIPVFNNQPFDEWLEVIGRRDLKTDELTELEIL